MPTPGLELASRSLLEAREGPGAGCRLSRSRVGVCRATGRAPLTLCSLSAAYWRFWLCVSVVYELFLIFILFQVRGFSRLHEWGVQVGVRWQRRLWQQTRGAECQRWAGPVAVASLPIWGQVWLRVRWSLLARVRQGGQQEEVGNSAP